MKRNSMLRIYPSLLLPLLLILTLAFAQTSRAGNETPDRAQLIPIGINALKKGDFDTAISIAKILLTNDPRDSEGYHLLAFAQAGRKDYIGLVRTLIVAEKHGVTSLDMHRMAAETFLNKGYVELALVSMEKYEEIWARQHNGRK